MHDQTRKFGVIYGTPVTNTEQFDKSAAKYGLKFAPGATISYPANDDPFGDPAVAQEQAPIAITKFKSAGVTTVLLLSDSGMTGALLKQATANDYHPEWIIGAFNYNDIPFFARQYDQDQWRHTFGISNLPPPIKSDDADAANPALDTVQWYWGEGKGTSSVLHGNLVDKFTQAVMYAGPNLTPKTLQQGLFAAPAQGGSAGGLRVHHPSGIRPDQRTPLRRVPRRQQGLHAGLVGPRHRRPATTEPGPAGRTGAVWYLNGGERFYASHWPTKPLKFFDKSNSIIQFDAQPTPPVPVPCTGCRARPAKGNPRPRREPHP